MKNELPLLQNTGRGTTIYYKNRYLYHHKEPEANAVAKMALISPKANTLYFVPSPLLFYGIKELINKLPDSSVILCCEKDHYLHEITQHYFDCLSFNNLYYITSPTAGDVITLLSNIGIHSFRRTELLSISGGYTLSPSYYRKIYQALSQEIDTYWQNRMTCIHMAPLWIKNIYFNISGNLTSFFCGLPEIYKPIMVTGAGPSLEFSIEIIKEKRNLFFLLTVDTAFPILLEHNIVPDMVIAEDAQFLNYMDFISTGTCAIPLLFDLTGYTAIPRSFSSSKYFFISSFADSYFITKITSLFPGLPVLPPLGSVGASAVYCAAIMVKNTKYPIFYTGIDFSYILGKSHAKGAPFIIHEYLSANRFNPPGRLDPFFRRPLIQNKDKNGLTCLTDLILATQARTMDQTISSITRQDEATIYDMSNKGLFSGGTPLPPDTADSDIESLLSTDKDTTKKARAALSNENLELLYTDDIKNEVKDFLNRESAGLQEIYSLGLLFLQEGYTDEKYFHLLLKEFDYIYLHFPDYKKPLPMEAGFIKRLLISISHYDMIIKQAKKLL